MGLWSLHTTASVPTGELASKAKAKQSKAQQSAAQHSTAQHRQATLLCDYRSCYSIEQSPKNAELQTYSSRHCSLSLHTPALLKRFTFMLCCCRAGLWDPQVHLMLRAS
jgi:hypothetical protein